MIIRDSNDVEIAQNLEALKLSSDFSLTYDGEGELLVELGTINVSTATQFSNTLTVGVDDTGYDVKFFGATTGKSWLWDESADKMIVTGASSFSEKIELALNGGAASASGLLMGVGTTADPATTSTADAKFIEIRSESTATSGDSRGLYWRHSINGAGLSGETIRAFTKLEAAGATVRGAHLSLDVASGGSASGLGVGVDNQILVHDGALTGGTYAVINSEIYSSGASTDVSGVTQMSFFRANLGGNATGLANVEDNAYLLSLAGGSNASGNIVGAVGNEPTWTSKTHLIRCNLNGTDIYLVGVQL